MRCLYDNNKFIVKRFLQKFCCETTECRQAEKEFQNQKRNESQEKLRAGFKPIQKQTAKNVERRKEDRAGYSVFFLKMIQKMVIEKINCQNCGSPIRKPDVSNVCHVLSKRLHPEIACNESNVIFLGGLFDACFCHQQFDSSLSKRETMPAFKIAAAKIKPILHLVTSKSKELTQIEDYIDNNNF